jgi:NTE family protein
MSRCGRALLLLFVLGGLLPGEAALAAERPRIGLALSGGGARGAAHVGVIRVLEELGIPIDYIAGTSMGAIVGGLYASGMSSKELERTLADMDLDDVFKDLPARPERSIRRKTDDRLYMTRLEAGVKGTQVAFKPALVLGLKFNLVLRHYTLPVSQVQDFDRLRIPFRCVATNIENGQPVVLGSGDLAQAMVASMAVPAAFGAVEREGLMLVDGGMANNLPISVVRAMGADIVIAVDISAPLVGRDKLRNPIAVLDQLTTLMTRRTADMEIASLGKRDLLIVPDLKDIGSMDFKRAAEATAIGEKSARAMQTRLAALSLPADQYQAYLAGHPAPVRDMPRMAFVRVVNQSHLDDEVLVQNLGLSPGDRLDEAKLEAGMARLYGLDVFESVRYRVVEEKGQQGVVVEAKERSWGTNTLQAGMELATGLSAGSSFNIGAAYTLRPLNGLNGEWRTLGSLGEEPSLVTEIYQPLNPTDDYFMRGLIGYQAQTTRVYEGGQARSEFDIQRYGLELSGGRNLERWGRLELGLRRYWGDAEQVVGAGDAPVGSFDDGQAFGRLVVDTEDNVYFPRSGQVANLSWTASRSVFGADTEFDQLRAQWRVHQSWGNHTLTGALDLGTTLDDAAPPQNLFRTGGFLHLSGLSKNEIAGQHLGLGVVGYMYRLSDNSLAPLYVGASLEAGNVWQRSGDFGSDLIHAASVFTGADTPLGPLYLSYGAADTGTSAFYLFLGQPWL